VDDNEQHLAYQRAINHAFADIVDNYGPRVDLDDDQYNDHYYFDNPRPTPPDHPSRGNYNAAAINEFIVYIFDITADYEQPNYDGYATPQNHDFDEYGDGYNCDHYPADHRHPDNRHPK
jgi:hypothetical protein